MDDTAILTFPALEKTMNRSNPIARKMTKG